MKFNELSNEEAVFIYNIMMDGLDTFEDVIENKGLSHVADTPFGKVTIFKEFSDDDLESITSSEKYKLFKEIVEKLRPIVELIGETQPELVDKIEELLYPSVEEDDDEEEDL